MSTLLESIKDWGLEEDAASIPRLIAERGIDISIPGTEYKINIKVNNITTEGIDHEFDATPSPSRSRDVTSNDAFAYWVCELFGDMEKYVI